MRLEGKVVTFKMTKLMAALKDFTIPFNDAGDKLVKYFGEQVFNDQGLKGIRDESWAPWAESTIIARAKRQGHYKAEPERTDQILVWTGALHRGFVKDITPTSLRISNEVEYFQFAQLDRPMLRLNAEVEDIVYRSIYEYVTPIYSR